MKEIETQPEQKTQTLRYSLTANVGKMTYSDNNGFAWIDSGAELLQILTRMQIAGCEVLSVNFSMTGIVIIVFTRMPLF
jgi:hypothetical protein